MKLISVFHLLLSVALAILSTGCISKTARGTASVTTKTVYEYADYTMANVVSVNRLPAGTGSVELSGASDDVSVTLSLWHSYGENSENADLTLSVRNQPAISGRMSGSSRGSLASKHFTAIMSDVRQNGWRPAAFPVMRTLQLRIGGLPSYPPDQHSELIRATLLEGRDQLFVIYADLRPQQ